MTKTLVVIESPFAGATDELRATNLRFARRALRDSILRGESPIASHLLYTQDFVLRDNYPTERALGIECGLAWLRAADRHVFYTDRGWSPGMLAALYESPRFFFRVYLRGLDFPPRLPPAEVIAELPKNFFILENKE